MLMSPPFSCPTNSSLNLQKLRTDKKFYVSVLGTFLILILPTSILTGKFPLDPIIEAAEMNLVLALKSKMCALIFEYNNGKYLLYSSFSINVIC